MQSSRLLVLLVAVATTGAAEELTAETSVERPELLAVVSAPEDGPAEGANEPHGGRESSRGVTDTTARQGVPGGGGGGGAGPGLFTMALGALNPMPYLIGGLNGVRQVMQQRLNPYQGYYPRNIPQRHTASFRNPGRPVRPVGNGGGGGRGSNIGIRHVGSGGSKGRHRGTNNFGSSGRHTGGTGGGSIRDVRATVKPDALTNTGDKPQPNFLRTRTTTTKQPAVGLSSPSLASLDFGTPKPGSIVVSTGRPNSRPHAASNVNSFPSPLTSPNAADSFPSSASSKKNTRVINIQVPEEMHNLTVLEISMKANGDVSLSGHDQGTVTPPPPPPLLTADDTNPPEFPPFLPGVADMFSEDQRLHGPHTRNNVFDSGFNTNTEGLGFDVLDYQDPEFVLAQPLGTGINSIQDILRMQTLGNTNNAFGVSLPLDLNALKPVNNLQSDVSTMSNLVQYPQSLLRNSPAPQVSSSFLPGKQNHIYLLPLSVPSPAASNIPAPQGRNFPTSQIRNFPGNNFPGLQVKNVPVLQGNNFPALLGKSFQTLQGNSFPAVQGRTESTGQKQLRQQTSDSGSPVLYIDITIPGNAGAAPSVNTRHLRGKRSVASLQFDGWYPMDVSNPMEDDPTIGYQPPPLQRVHFSNEPVSEKPMFPVRPENPPVFVVRAEPRNPEYHSVYGTENVEYFHIHPQTNTVRAFRAPSQSVGAIRFVPAPQLSADQQSSSRLEEESSTRPVPYAYLTSDFDYKNIPPKVEGFADKSDPADATSAHGDIQYFNKSDLCDPDCEDMDMEGAFSETRHAIIRRPRPGFSFNQQGQDSDRPQNAHSYRYRLDPFPIRRSDQVNDESKTSRPALYELLGNIPSGNQEQAYLGSATDSAGTSFIRKLPPPHFRYSTKSRSTQPKQTSPSYPKEITGRKSEIFSETTRPWFLIDTRPDSTDRRREPSIASYIHPETHVGDEKIHYKPFGPVSYVSKEGSHKAADHIHNPHLDDHMNSYKPTLTANSLSELLQIFRFTSVTEPGTEEPVTVREFRYTRPTETPPTTPSYGDEATNRTIFPSSFRYTPSPSKFSDPTTEAGVTKKPPREIYDAVADTNSLDGYLFSDSEASPEYAHHPQVRPNVVVSDGKEEKPSKVNVKEEESRVRVSSRNTATSFRDDAVTMPEEAFDGLEIIYSGPASSSSSSATRTTATSWPLYIIHQGHSKVQVYGINSGAEKSSSGNDFTDIYLVSTGGPSKYSSSSVSPTTNATTSTLPITVAAASTSTTTTTTTHSSSTTTLTTLSSTTTTTPSPSTTTTTPSTFTTNSTTTTASSTTTSPYPVEPNSTTGTSPLAAPGATVPDYDTLGEEAATEAVPGEYDYYYHDSADDYHIPDLAFGDDYGPPGGRRGWFRPSLQLPGPPSLPHLALPTPPAFIQGPPRGDLPSGAPFSHVFQGRLPQVNNPNLPQTDPYIPLSPAVALSRAELSVARPVFFTKREPDAVPGREEDIHLSHPFEYLSQLRSLQEEATKPPAPAAEDDPEDHHNNNINRPLPQPRMKRLTVAPAAT